MRIGLDFPFKATGGDQYALASRIDELRTLLALQPPDRLANNTGAMYLDLGQGRGEFHLELIGSSIIITYPDFIAIYGNNDAHLSKLHHALALYYFHQSDGEEISNRWVSFSEIPEGRIYSSAFQGYTGDLLSRKFKLNISDFDSVCQKAGGAPIVYGDAAYLFHLLPRLDVIIVYHLGDDEFQSTCNLLFNKNVDHYLPTEACAILGRLLIHKLLV